MHQPHQTPALVKQCTFPNRVQTESSAQQETVASSSAQQETVASSSSANSFQAQMKARVGYGKLLNQRFTQPKAPPPPEGTGSTKSQERSRQKSLRGRSPSGKVEKASVCHFYSKGKCKNGKECACVHGENVAGG